MIKLVVMYPWPKDPVQFKSHYVAKHFPLCRELPGVVGMHYAFEPETVQGSTKWFCIFEATYPDHDTLRASLASPQGIRAAADVPTYSPDPPTAFVYEPHS
jgi:uncharacterized protein (TIGR02118 family)